MASDRRSFLHAAGGSLILGAASVWRASAQAPAPPVSFPGLANPLEGGVEVIATRFNSPNDLVVAQNGDVYFTDPPYGLAGVQKSPLRELAYTGATAWIRPQLRARLRVRPRRRSRAFRGPTISRLTVRR